MGGGRCIIQFVGGGLGWESIVTIGEFNNCFLRLGVGIKGVLGSCCWDVFICGVLRLWEISSMEVKRM